MIRVVRLVLAVALLLGSQTAVASPAFATSSAAPSVADAVADGTANAAAMDIQQSVTVVSRATGEVLASHKGGQVFNSESIVKLFTAAYYLEQAAGAPDAELLNTLQAMIENSDDGIQRSLFKTTIVPTIVDRYGLTSTRSANRASSGNWGSTKITADDEAKFLYEMSKDPVVGPFLMPWMASAAPDGADGFNQFFGLNAVVGDHGSKQGWSDSGWEPYNLHSVGWTGDYFVAILQTSYSAGTTELRETSTYTAKLLTQAMLAAQPPPPPYVASAATVGLCDSGNGGLIAKLFRETVGLLEAVLPQTKGTWCASS